MLLIIWTIIHTVILNCQFNRKFELRYHCWTQKHLTLISLLNSEALRVCLIETGKVRSWSGGGQQQWPLSGSTPTKSVARDQQPSTGVFCPGHAASIKDRQSTAFRKLHHRTAGQVTLFASLATAISNGGVAIIRHWQWAGSHVTNSVYRWRCAAAYSQPRCRIVIYHRIDIQNRLLEFKSYSFQQQ